METNNKIGCVIMASGLGKRFGGNKLMADFGGKPMVQWILDATKDVFEHRIVVTRNKQVEALCMEQHIPVLFHQLPGRNDTIRLGIEALSREVSGCIFCPADQPFLRKETLKKLRDSAIMDNATIWRLSYQEKCGSPVYFPSILFEELCKLPEGKGGNLLVQKYSDRVKTIPVLKEEELLDIDTREDYERLIKNRY